MTDLAAGTPTHAGPDPAESPDSRFVRHLLGMREGNQAARSALRRGDQRAMAYRALPYLAPWFSEQRARQLDAALLFGAALATHTRVRQADGVALGSALYVHARGQHVGGARFDPGESMPGRRVIAMQRQRLPVAHRTLSGLLAQLDATATASLDWLRLWRLYQGWDSADPARQRWARQGVLLDFFGSETRTPKA